MSALPGVSPDHIVDVPSEVTPPAQSQWKGRCVNIIYAPPTFGILASGAGAFNSGLSSGFSLNTTLFIVAGVALVIALVLVAKYGDLARSINKIQKETQTLTRDITTLTSTNLSLGQENQTLKASVETLEKTNAAIQQSVLELEATVKSLQQTNLGLKEKIEELEQIIQTIESKTGELKEKNIAFQEGLSKLSAEQTQLNHLNGSLNQTGIVLKTQLERNLSDLEAEMEKAHNFSKELIETLMKKSDELQGQLDQLRDKETVYTEQNARLSEEIQKLKASTLSADHTEASLSALAAETEASIASLKESQEQFAKEKEEFMAKMATDQNQLAQQILQLEKERALLETLQKSLAQTVQDEQTLNAEIEQQLKD